MEGSPHGKSGGGPFDESSADTFRKQQRDRSQTRSAAGPGRSERWNVHHLTPSRLQRESPTHPHVPCERRTDPAEPTQTRSAAGSGRSEHWNVHHLTPSRLQRESPTHPHVPCERRTGPAKPTHKPAAQRDRAGASIGTSTTYSPRAFSAKAPLIPTFPASVGPVPRSPPAHSSSDVGL